MTSFAEVAQGLQPGAITWSVRVDDLTAGPEVEPRALLHEGSETELPTASIGKILLLLTVAGDIESGRLDPHRPCAVHPDDRVADSGMLQHLHRQDLPPVDHAVLVGALSDNLATNVLLRAVGLPRVQALTAALGLRHVALHDQVRAGRGPHHPPYLSTANADDLIRLVTGLHRGSLHTPQASAQVVDWLRYDTDTSMVAGAFGVDPLCHWDADRGVSLWHKTGTNTGTRADCGVVATTHGALAYAAIARWQPQGDADPLREQVLDTMAGLGAAMRTHLH